MGLYDLEENRNSLFFSLNIQRFASGTINGGNYNSIYSYYIIWSAISNGPVANSSDLIIQWIYKKNKTDPYNAWNKTDSTKVKFNIDGVDTNEKVAHFDLRSASVGSTQVLRTYTTTIHHNNDGSRVLKVGGTHVTGTSWGTKSISPVTITLDKIPRYANITTFYASIPNGLDGLNKAKFTWYANVNCDAVQYSLNNGSWINGVHPTTEINNLDPGTTYSLKIRIKRTDSQLWTESNKIIFTTTQKNKITSGVPNISNGNELNVTASNPSGAECRIALECPIGARRIVKSGLNVTFTDEEINSLMEYMNETTAAIRVTADTLNNEKILYSDSVDGIYTIVGSAPTFNHFEYEDINDTTLILTGNKKTCVIGYSDIKATIPVANKAIAQNYATMKKYRFVCGNAINEANYSNDSDVSMAINKIPNSVFSVYAIDSRGLYVVVNKVPLNVINYLDIQKNSSIIASRVNARGEVVGASEKVKVSLSGKLWKGNFGKKENGIKSFVYRYKISSSDEWSNWLNINTSLVTIDDEGNFEFSNLIKGDTDEGFSEANSYNIELIINDELSSVSYATNIGRAIPHVAYHKNGLSFMGGYNEEIGSPIQRAGDCLFPIGYIYMSVNDINPSNYFGGSWARIKDRFLLACGDEYENGTTGGNSTIPELHCGGSNYGFSQSAYYSERTIVRKSAISEEHGEIDANISNMPPYLAVYIWKRTK